MGKSNDPQPAHSSADADSIILKLLPSPSSPHPLYSVGGVTTPTAALGKLACSHTLDATRPSPPSPLTFPSPSKMPPTCYNADSTSFSSSPFLSLSSDVKVGGDEVFYDASDGFLPQPYQPVRTGIQQTLPDPEFNGTPKSHTEVAPGRNSGRHIVHSPMPLASFTSVGPGYGSPRPTIPLAPLHPSRIVKSLRDSLARRTFVRRPVRKALLVRINYAYLGEDRRLYNAAEDASRAESLLKKSGFSPENIIVLHESSRSEPPTLDCLTRHIGWLVGDAQKGDSLHFVFSGGLDKNRGILTMDGRFISKEQLYMELVQPIPAGCELQITFDCCYAASIAPLLYCVGHMAPPSPLEVPRAESSSPTGSSRSSFVSSGWDGSRHPTPFPT